MVGCDDREDEGVEATDSLLQRKRYSISIWVEVAD